MRIAPPPLAGCAAAALLFLPTIRYGWVQDDRAIIALNPAVHSIPAAVRAIRESALRESRVPEFDFYVLSDSTSPASWVAEELEWQVGTRDDAVRSDVVCCVTPGHEIVIDAGSMHPGLHLIMLGADGPG